MLECIKEAFTFEVSDVLLHLQRLAGLHHFQASAARLVAEAGLASSMF